MTESQRKNDRCQPLGQHAVGLDRRQAARCGSPHFAFITVSEIFLW